MKIKACLTSKQQNWKTPTNIYNIFVKQYCFFDPCPANPEFDGLAIEWEDHNFVNPPYNKQSLWIDKAIEEMKKNKIIVLLIPARTDTKNFRKLYENNAKFIFIQGRLKFSEGGAAPFPSMFVILRKEHEKPIFELMTKEDMERDFR